MNRNLAFALVACCLTAADDPGDNRVKQDMAKLQGAWTCIAMDCNGEPAPEELLKEINARLNFHGPDLTMTSNETDGAIRTRFELDPSATPKHIDLISEPRTLGIYEIEGDTLKFCLGVDDRPTTFAGKFGRRASSQVFKRVIK